MADHDRTDPRDAELAAISAALDDEGPMPPHPSDAGRRFAESATAVRRTVRMAEAEPMPDMRGAVLAELRGDAPDSHRDRRPLLAAAAAFVLGVAVAGAFLLDRGLDSAELAAAELSERILVAQTTITSLDADVAVVERGAHPELTVRRYEGTLQWRTPERLALALREVTARPDGWPANDVSIVVDEDEAWRTRRRACPVDALPGCLEAPVVSGVEHRPPFSAGWAAPLDLVLPVGAVVAETGDIRTDDNLIVIDTTVGRARALVEATLDNGAFRQVHADDRMEIRIDAETFTLRGFSIRAEVTTARGLWATTWGYDDATGDEIFRFDLSARPEVQPFVAGDRPSGLSDAGFREDLRLVGPPGLAIAEGFALHRRGTIEVTGAPSPTVISWADGRAWITLHTIESASRTAPAGAEALDTGAGVVHLDRARNEVVVLTGTERVTLSGSVGLDELITMADSLPHVGLDAEHDADRARLTIEVGGTVVAVTLAPGVNLPPPDRGDVVGVAVRGTLGRHSPTLGTLTWLEDGTVVVLTADADLPLLLAAAGELVLP